MSYLCISNATPRVISSTSSSKSSLDAVSSDAGDDLSRVASATASSVGGWATAAAAAPDDDDEVIPTSESQNVGSFGFWDDDKYCCC